MKISDWNEVSDSYVDGELSEEEMAQIRALNQDKAFYDLRRGR